MPLPGIIGKQSGRAGVCCLFDRNENIAFTGEAEHLQFHFLETLPKHPNGITFRAWDDGGTGPARGRPTIRSAAASC